MPFTLRSLASSFRPYFTSRSLASSCRPYFTKATFNGVQKLSFPRKALPPVYIPCRHFDSIGFVADLVSNVIDMRSIHPKTRRDTKNHEKMLAIAYWSIGEEEKARQHYEPDNSLDLFPDENDFDIYTHFFSLLTKKKQELTVKELKEIIVMYQITTRLSDPTTTASLKNKLKECKILLLEKKKL